MRVRVEIRHGVGGDGRIVAMFECLSRGGLDPHAGRNSCQDNTSDPAAAELQIKVCSKERTPLSLGDDDVLRLPVQSFLEIGVVRQEFGKRLAVRHS